MCAPSRAARFQEGASVSRTAVVTTIIFVLFSPLIA